jgi:hypothetical protein
LDESEPIGIMVGLGKATDEIGSKVRCKFGYMGRAVERHNGRLR